MPNAELKMDKPNFFDVAADLAARKRAAALPRQAAGAAPAEPAKALSVTEVTAIIDKAVKQGVPPSLSVRGEVSNFNRHGASGHLYFTLKDANACINCVMWKDAAARLKFAPRDGMELIATGGVRVFAPQGKYQLYVNSLTPVGQGALELAFRQLHAKLQAEGLFATERKKPLPVYPLCITLITSQSGAALQDMLKVLRPFPWLRLCVYHVPVQGDGSAEKIAEAIAHLNRRHKTIGGVDVILLGRGGGSLEDLWEFNEEIVARAMAASAIPIITGIGHEVDVSIADLVADYHAHTPTEAARVATAGWKNIADVLDQHHIALRRSTRQFVQNARQRLEAIQRHEIFRRPLDRIQNLRQLLDERHVSLSAAIHDKTHTLQLRLLNCSVLLEKHHPRNQLRLHRQRVDELRMRLDTSIQTRLQRTQEKVNSMSRVLSVIGPEQVLARGYSITRNKKTGEIIKSKTQVKGGEKLVTRVTDGQIESTAQDPNQPSLF